MSAVAGVTVARQGEHSAGGVRFEPRSARMMVRGRLPKRQPEQHGYPDSGVCDGLPHDVAAGRHPVGRVGDHPVRATPHVELRLSSVEAPGLAAVVADDGEPRGTQHARDGPVASTGFQDQAGDRLVCEQRARLPRRRVVGVVVAAGGHYQFCAACAALVSGVETGISASVASRKV